MSKQSACREMRWGEHVCTQKLSITTTARSSFDFLESIPFIAQGRRGYSIVMWKAYVLLLFRSQPQ